MWPWWFKLVIWLAQMLVVLVMWPYTSLVAVCHRPRRPPPPRSPLLAHSATTLARLISTRQVSCVDVVAAYIERIKEVDPIVNGVVEDRYGEAMEEAKAVDAMLSEQDRKLDLSTKPLLGVPITIKESIAVSGMSQNGGRTRPKERRALSDAVAVEHLREAGAIILCVTNTPELCVFWETYNNAHGITRNPYNTRYSAGGSSGGECSLIGAGASVIGLGSDIVGSGRLPALYCGTFGHKPTPRTISVEGHLPVSEDPDWSRFLVLSPLARFAEDLPLVMSCASPSWAQILRLHQPVEVSKLRVFYMEERKSVLFHSVDRDLKASVRAAALHFRTKYDCEVTKVDFDELDDTLQAASSLMLRMKPPHTVFQRSEDTEDWNLGTVLWEMMKRLVGLSHHTLYALIFGLLIRFAQSTSDQTVQDILRIKTNWQNRLQELLAEDGVLLMPTFPHKACLHYQMYYKLTNTPYMSALNFLELPATHCPMGISNSGLPVGLQVVAWKNQDRLTFAVAKELEAAFGGWVPPYKQAAQV